jgi:branched-chain amino acid aminotransferase
MPATRFNGLPIGDGLVGQTTKRLLQAWSALAGVDIVAQAEGQLRDESNAKRQTSSVKRQT